MIGSVAASGAHLNAYSLAQAAASAISAPTEAASQEMTPQQAGLGDLTAADWKLVSAAVGKNVGPDASGNIPGVQPLLAYAIQMNRQDGDYAPGQELTVGNLQTMAIGEQSSGFLGQIHNAIAYLEQNQQTSLGSSSSGRAVNITA
ncbi:MAG: hypothetical protein ACRDNS_18425 [Trebonia sp.]